MLPLLARSAGALSSWTPPAHRVAELFPRSADAEVRNADPSAVFVVTGANRGIGVHFVEQLLARTVGTVYACARDPSQIAFAASERVRPVRLDVRDDASVAALAEAVGDRVDVLLNVAGVLHDASHQPERALDRLSRDWLLASMDVNCAGPILVTQALRRALAAGRRGSTPSARPATVVANLSARVGSIGDNGLGGWYSYRASKAALNMMTKTAAIELKKQRTACIALHPGTTDTGLSAPFQKNVQPAKLFPAAFTATQLLDIVDGVDLDAHSGGFFAWDGTPIEY